MVATWFAGCKSTAAQSDLQNDENAGVTQFIGCRPSAGECVHSCPQRDGTAQQIEDLCPTNSREPMACFCPVAAAPAALEPPASTHTYVGCRPSAGECLNSCPQRNGHFVAGSQRCKNERDRGACFCPH